MESGTTLGCLVIAVLVFVFPGLTEAQFDAHAPEPLAPLDGTLFLHGGGAVDSDMRQRFTILSGGKEARIVLIATAKTSDPLNAKKIEEWLKHQPKSVDFLHAESRDQVTDSNFEALLDNATGVWFSGGKQTLLMKIYAGTKVEDGVLKLLARGGIVGGTSAGASIQGDYMPRGDPLGNTQMMAEGYERGLGFLTGDEIDAHTKVVAGQVYDLESRVIID